MGENVQTVENSSVQDTQEVQTASQPQTQGAQDFYQMIDAEKATAQESKNTYNRIQAVESEIARKEQEAKDKAKAQALRQKHENDVQDFKYKILNTPEDEMALFPAGLAEWLGSGEPQKLYNSGLSNADVNCRVRQQMLKTLYNDKDAIELLDPVSRQELGYYCKLDPEDQLTQSERYISLFDRYKINAKNKKTVEVKEAQGFLQDVALKVSDNPASIKLMQEVEASGDQYLLK